MIFPSTTTSDTINLRVPIPRAHWADLKAHAERLGVSAETVVLDLISLRVDHTRLEAIAPPELVKAFGSMLDEARKWADAAVMNRGRTSPRPMPHLTIAHQFFSLAERPPLLGLFKQTIPAGVKLFCKQIGPEERKPYSTLPSFQAIWFSAEHPEGEEAETYHSVALQAISPHEFEAGVAALQGKAAQP